MYRILTFLLAMLLALPVFGQMKPRLTPSTNHVDPAALAPVQPLRPSVPPAAPLLGQSRYFSTVAQLSKPVKGQPKLQAYLSPDGTPYAIHGEFGAGAGRSPSEQATEYFAAVENLLQLDSPGDEFAEGKTTADGERTHLRFHQQWQGIPVYGGEVVLHKKGDVFYLLNGRFFPSPTLTDLAPGLTPAEATDLAMAHVAQFTEVKNLSAAELRLLPSGQTAAELVIYHPANDAEGEMLAYHVTVVPNIAHRFSYFVNAETGEIIEHRSELCKLTGHFHGPGNHVCEATQNSLSADRQEKLKTENPELPPPPGPETATATDLLGQSRLINVYETGGTFFLIDASRDMFSTAQSNIPNDPAGVIWTINGQNNSPENNDFEAAHVTSSNNTWNNPTAVSAHYNASLAYEYFKETFGRESINGQGGNIVSLINITESNGAGMDNAFWNGNAMFYGNGDQAFSSPLARSLDVAGHEMSHGVVQATANLEYEGESGALNESFADIFGVMIDRNDWKLGEDVVDSGIFPTGALRDMENPNNGGNSLNDNGWQPDHYSDRYTGSEDNGGVHINSGIVNKAFQLFATSVGKGKAEQVYYRALNQYLVKSSQFIDCRIAVIQAATDLHGANSAEVTAAQNAFTSVGIGSGSGTNSQTDVGGNPGDDFVLYTDDNYTELKIFTPDGTPIADPLTNISPLSRPSITDDGSFIVYVDDDNIMQAIELDWQTSEVDQFVLQSDPIWRQAAVSKDGTHFAALTTDYDNSLYIYDFGLEEWQTFLLTNPTTGQGGPTTGDVQYADVLEWDFTGQWVMYDALNAISTTSGTDIEYWDISFANVWDNGANNFTSPNDFSISKLFSQLPEDVSVGNPTFSKNSDYIIAFDYFDTFNDEYFLLGTNLETSETGTIFENNDLSWPNYSTDDNEVIFDAEDDNGNLVLGRVGVANDKITGSGNAVVLFPASRWGVWFANGDRVLSGAAEVAAAELGLLAYPNPVADELTIEFTSSLFGEAEIQLCDLVGRLLLSQNFPANQGENRRMVPLGHLPKGPYFLKINLPDGNAVVKISRK